MKQATNQPVKPTRTPLKRRLLLAGAGAAAAGAGLGWWHFKAGTLPAEGLASASDGDFWALKFPGLDGDAVVTRKFLGKPLLVNFWATWCPPCVEELPLLDAFYNKNRANGWQVLGLAVDRLEAVQAFLRLRPLTFPIAVVGAEGIAISKTLGNIAGGLPFTLVFNAAGAVAQRKSGAWDNRGLSALTEIK